MFNFLGFALRAWYRKKLSLTSCSLSALVNRFLQQNITTTMKAILVTFLFLQLVILNEGLRKLGPTRFRNCPASQKLLALKKALGLRTGDVRTIRLVDQVSVSSSTGHSRQKRGVSKHLSFRPLHELTEL